MFEMRPTKENARAFFDLYMGRKDKVLADFMARSEATGGPKASELNYTKESLIPLWLWVRDRTPYAPQHPPLDLLPPWYSFELVTNPHRQRICFTSEAAANLDGLSYYFGETLLRYVPDTQWDIGPYPKDGYFGKPVVRSEFFANYPIHMNIVRASIYNEEPHEMRVTPTSLAGALQECIAREVDYRADYMANGKHDDPRVKRRIKFK